MHHVIICYKTAFNDLEKKMEKAGSVCAEIDEIVCLIIFSLLSISGLVVAILMIALAVGGGIDKNEFGSKQTKR